MVKIKVYRLQGGHREIGKSSMGVSDYAYCVYFFGFLVHSVTLYDIGYDAAESIFKGVEVIDTKG